MRSHWNQVTTHIHWIDLWRIYQTQWMKMTIWMDKLVNTIHWNNQCMISIGYHHNRSWSVHSHVIVCGRATMARLWSMFTYKLQHISDHNRQWKFAVQHYKLDTKMERIEKVETKLWNGEQLNTGSLNRRPHLVRHWSIHSFIWNWLSICDQTSIEHRAYHNDPIAE